jgi:hypothetical protein
MRRVGRGMRNASTVRPISSGRDEGWVSCIPCLDLVREECTGIEDDCPEFIQVKSGTHK